MKKLVISNFDRLKSLISHRRLWIYSNEDGKYTILFKDGSIDLIKGDERNSLTLILKVENQELKGLELKGMVSSSLMRAVQDRGRIRNRSNLLDLIKYNFDSGCDVKEFDVKEVEISDSPLVTSTGRRFIPANEITEEMRRSIVENSSHSIGMDEAIGIFDEVCEILPENIDASMSVEDLVRNILSGGQQVSDGVEPSSDRTVARFIERGRPSYSIADLFNNTNVARHDYHNLNPSAYRGVVNRFESLDLIFRDEIIASPVQAPYFNHTED